ncbi:hypothetical protein [Kushneria indalinina]|uniref:Uncharacterized protein n=1 Tax=Kushneria indalinina DSM 14324 TaxID=1122140 RepID=A0A3D9DRH7_9GAMM|nr:hypothetical protein [Kushneria indalinina]REC93307.1 hypothetical protein C8D72_3463 [Kushneria indalinina DSM 14324]
MDRLNESRIVKLTHHYSLLKDEFYGVRTSLIPEDLMLACAYVQLLRDELPDFTSVDDCIGESEGMALLSALYGAEELRKAPPEGAAEEIDFHENWETVASLLHVRDYQGAFSRVVRPGARLAVIDVMLRCARKNAPKGCSENDRDVEILEHIQSGGDVPAEWGLRTITGAAYTGTIPVTGEDDYPSR